MKFLIHFSSLLAAISALNEFSTTSSRELYLLAENIPALGQITSEIRQKVTDALKASAAASDKFVQQVGTALKPIETLVNNGLKNIPGIGLALNAFYSPTLQVFGGFIATTGNVIDKISGDPNNAELLNTAWKILALQFKNSGIFVNSLVDQVTAISSGVNPSEAAILVDTLNRFIRTIEPTIEQLIKNSGDASLQPGLANAILGGVQQHFTSVLAQIKALPHSNQKLASSFGQLETSLQTVIDTMANRPKVS